MYVAESAPQAVCVILTAVDKISTDAERRAGFSAIAESLIVEWME